MSINGYLFYICLHCFMVGAQFVAFLFNAVDGRSGLALLCISFAIFSALMVRFNIKRLKKAVGRS